ncbi:transglutaminase TgpA family protein [Lacisediminihabitans changchengi]|uniref:Transglutaminase domain-containing protein n=1 Tax=Lacisediminihabitans changchengi TaxID=2787634 RepID=A0A934SIH6_9MICO|nr:DUF3488 and transglutaminase-like domain-containing protein [Lacisediminihabitans changchengi]MBK4346213.1 transglutaminase domain-containing protein [Lacisediminihabitans changchengi]
MPRVDLLTPGAGGAGATTADPRRALGADRQRARWNGRKASSDWQVSLLLLALLIVVISGLHVILSGAAWAFQLSLVALLVLGVSALVRTFSRALWLPPVIAAAVFLGAMTAFFAQPTAILAAIPTPDTFGAFSALVSQANLSIAGQSLPAVADAGITFLLCFAVAGIALAADVLAILLRAPALAGVPVIVLLAVPSVVEPGATDPIVFVIATVLYLLLLRVGGPRRQGRLSLAMGAVAVVLALVVPAVLPQIDDSTTSQSAGFGTGVNPVLSLGDDLRRSSARDVLTYSTSSGNAHYLRLVSVGNFRGVNWEPDDFRLDRRNSVDAIDTAPGLRQDVPRKRDTTSVTIESLTSEWLPMPYPATKVTGLQGDWFWDSEGRAVSSPNRSVTGQQYQVSDLEVQPTPEQLLAAGTTVPAGLEQYLAVPANLPSLVTDTAREVVGTAPTNYEKALLLQAFFHDGDFEYSETAPVADGYDGTGAGVVARFLTEKAGYCIHFASAMAVMARVLGIPARISVGFLPGTQIADVNGRSTFQVDSHDLHAWPELYFEGIGWTRFEPTVSRGDLPSYADLSTPDVPIPSASDNPTPTSSASASASVAPTAAPEPSASARADGSAAAAESADVPWWIALVVLLLLVLLLAPAVIRQRERRRRARDLALGRAPVLVAWLEVLQSAEDLRRPISETMTPREAAAELGGGDAVERLVAALERERFSEFPVADGGAVDDMRAVIAVLRRGVPGRTRTLAVLFPPSVWSRMRGAVGLRD